MFSVEQTLHFGMAAKIKQAFVLIGTQGCGKSATGNSIIGTKSFSSSSGTKPLTVEIKAKSWHWQENDITIIDTPPLQGLDEFTNIQKYLANKKYTSIIYGFVISIGRIVDNEQNLLQMIYKQLHPHKNLVLIFSRFDDLDPDKSYESWISECHVLKAFIDTTNVKCFPFSNKTDSKVINEQVDHLMSTITSIHKAVKYKESQPNMKDSTKVVTTKNVEHAKMESGAISQTTINEDILVNCQLLEEYFGKYGVMFYKEMLKNK